ncbi:hypothetical protein ABZP36_003626 [Zizania latifolia]
MLLALSLTYPQPPNPWTRFSSFGNNCAFRIVLFLSIVSREHYSRPVWFGRSRVPTDLRLSVQGFKKVVADRWEFANDGFKRGETHLLGGIQRRKGSGTGAAGPAGGIPTAIPISSPPTSSGGDPAVSSSSPREAAIAAGAAAGVSGAVAELEEENARLRRENARLARELARARHLCDGVRRLVSRYDHGGEEEGEGDEGPGDRGGKPMLFGVAIGGKRSRDENGDNEDDDEGADEDDDEDGEEEEEDDDDDDDDERHAARRGPVREGKARRTEPSDLDVLALSVRAAAAARPGGGSRDRKSSVS